MDNQSMFFFFFFKSRSLTKTLILERLLIVVIYEAPVPNSLSQNVDRLIDQKICLVNNFSLILVEGSITAFCVIKTLAEAQLINPVFLQYDRQPMMIIP